MDEGYEQNQAVAIALSKAGETPAKRMARGGMVKGFSPIARPQRFQEGFLMAIREGKVGLEPRIRTNRQHLSNRP